MIAIKPLDKEYDRDYTFLLSGGEVAELGKKGIKGALYKQNTVPSPDYKPYIPSGEIVMLGVDNFGCSSEFDGTFYLRTESYHQLRETGAVCGARYCSCQGHQLYVVNFDADRKWGSRIAQLIEQLGLRDNESIRIVPPLPFL